MKRTLFLLFITFLTQFAVSLKVNAENMKVYKGTITIYVGEEKTMYHSIPYQYYVTANSWFLRETNDHAWSDGQEKCGVKIVSKTSESCTIKGMWDNEPQFNGDSWCELHCKGTKNSTGEYYECYWTIIVKSSGSIYVDATPSFGNWDNPTMLAPGEKVYLSARTSDGSSVSDVKIYYDFKDDYSRPDENSTLYTSAGVTITQKTYLRAVAYKNGYSPVMCAGYFDVKTGPILVTSITLNKTSLTLQPEQSETLTATVKPDNATDKSVSWSSDMKSVAIVDNNGKVTAIAAGTATITCEANDGSGVKATCAVTVSDPEPPYPADIWFVSVTCDNINLDNLTKNDKLSMHATFENKGGTDEIYSMLALINLEATKIVANGDYDVREFKGGMTTTVDYEYALDTIPAGQYYATVLYYDWNEESWFYHGKESLYLITVKDSEPNPIVPGDVNGDGSANGTDLVALTNIILGKSDRTAAADVNGDGQVNGTDYVALVNIVLGRNNSRAVEYPKTDKRLNTPSKGIKIVDRKRIIKK